MEQGERRIWEHNMCKYRDDEEAWKVIEQQQKDGWQVAAMGTAGKPWEDGLAHWIVFKRPAPLEGPE